MGEMQQITIDEWMDWKEDIRRKLAETARNFVYIGYRLKQIRDSGMYDGAEDIFEFAAKEYGLSKSTVSRFIAINEKFSEGGNSLELKEEYREMGSSKLAEMLALTDAECSMITKKTTVAQIRELKDFNRQEPEEEEGPEKVEGILHVWTPLQKCIIEYFRGKKEMLDAAMGYIAGGDYKQAAETISPNGSTTFKKGIIFLFMYDFETGVKYKKFGTNDVTLMSWSDFIMEICEIFWPDYSMGINGYDALYKTPEPEKEKAEETPEILNEEDSVATSQQEEEREEKDAETMEEDDASEDGGKRDNDTPVQPADEDKSGNDEDGAGGSDGKGDMEGKKEGEEQDLIYMGKCSMADIVRGIPKPTEEELEEAKNRNMGMAADFDEEEEDKGPDQCGIQPDAGGLLIKTECMIEDLQMCFKRKEWDELIGKAEQVIRNVERIRGWGEG